MTFDIDTISGVIFDLEGTIVDFQWKISEAVSRVKEVIKGWGWTSRLLNISDYAELYNEGIRRAPNAEEERRFLNVADKVYDEYDKDALTRWAPQPGARQLLEALSKSQTPIALCSNVGRKAMDSILLLLGWNKVFSTTLSRNDVRFLKPDPEGLKRTIHLLGLEPSKVIFIGDSRTDILTAKNVRCHVAVAARGENTRKETEPLAPDYLLASLEPLIEILKVDEA